METVEFYEQLIGYKCLFLSLPLVNAYRKNPASNHTLALLAINSHLLTMICFDNSVL